VPVIEVTHGDGLGGSSFNYGFSAVPDQDLINRRGDREAGQDRLPDAARRRHHRRHPPGADNGASICRIATHCTEADISIQHFGRPRASAWRRSAS
jgi:4-hydroxy 2-oxovalerate aldolase